MNNTHEELINPDFGTGRLFTLYSYFFNSNKAVKKEAEAMLRRLSILDGITREEARLIAFMAQWKYSPWRSIGECAAALNVTTSETKTLLDSLIAKSVVYEGEKEGKALYRVDGDYESHLIRQSYMEGIDDKTMFSVLRGTANELLYQSFEPSTPLKTLDSVTALNENLTFAKGYRELGIAQLPIEEKVYFALLADHFLQYGVEAVRPRDFSVIHSDEDTKTSQQASGQLCEERSILEYGRREDMIIEGMKGLVQRGIAVIVPGDSDADHRASRDRDLCLLSVDACAKLFKGQDHLIGYDALSRMATLYKNTSIRSKDLFFEADFQPRVEEVVTLLDPVKYDAFTRRLEAKRLNKSLNILFYGDPGTGKTELAMQLARLSGRDIFVADVAKLEDSYWGESEKNYRNIFRSFSYMNAIAINPPILLLNEADGIVSKRLEVHRSSDKYINTIQNVLLEELERFEGVLIATTNLTVNMDKAFERRFPFKLCFRKPSPEIASRIWQMRFPYLAQEDLLRLAKEFPFSGGQIDNVAKRGDLYEVINGKTPPIEQIVEYCRVERLERDEGVASRTVINGFLDPK